ncbi:MAG TPA: histidine kinase [Rhodanobacteraceae bacterium]|jgi:two-component system sensor histidine kinase AlgZ|nr:histidine kinase [Rhodanobacteraceae bacterium]
MSATTTRRWLPQFCSLPTLFAVMIVAELVALVVVLVPDQQARSWLPRLGVTSVYVQWLALLNSVVLCSMRQSLEKLPARAGFVIAWLFCIAVTALGSAVVCRMDQALGLGLTVAAGEDLRFIVANAAIATLIAAALLRYLFVLELWQERVEAASKAQVDALQARIRPHFLFNSMNTIASLIRTRPAEAERTVEDLADLFRAALGSGDASGTLGEELDLMDHYLRIEKLRLGDRLRVDIEADDLPRDLPLPRLLLQPLVENAIYHGVQPLADGGTIRIAGRHLPGRVEITIRNPLPVDAAPARNGVALANIRARIEYHFGKRGELRVEPGNGEYTVTVRLPDASPDR